MPGGARDGTLALMQTGSRHHRYTYTEYVELELLSSTKHEFLDGEIYAMAGGSEEHSALAAEVLRALGNAVGDRPCRVHTSDLRIYVEAVGLATFPDGAVIRGQLEQHEPSPKATALNPMVLLEVTSDSSEEYDTGDKLRFYETIPSLKEYIVVSHRERRITVHQRQTDPTTQVDAWVARVAIPGGQVEVPSVGISLDCDVVYRNSNIR